MPKEGTKAPPFSLPDENGEVRSLADHKGSWVLLYFYPKDDTTGCTREACTIQDDLPQFSRLDCTVYGVSADSETSHRKFRDKYHLSFHLLSDLDKTTINAYGVWGKKKFMGREYEGILRTSFLINPEGKIAKVYQKVKPLEHAQEVLADLQRFNEGKKTQGKKGSRQGA